MVQLASPKAWGVNPLARELEGHRTKDSKTFLLPSGERQMVISRNLHYAPVPDENGMSYWDEVDLSFKPDAQDFAIDKNFVRSRVTKQGVAMWDRASNMGVIWLGAPGMAGDRKATMNDGVVNWEYVVKESGFKTAANIAVPIGARTFTFFYAKLGSWTFEVDALGNLVADWGMVPRAVFIGKSGLSYLCGPWRVRPGNRVEFDWDSAAIPVQEYPGVLDPTTTFTVAAGADDGFVQMASGAYPPSGSAIVSATSNTIQFQRSLNGATYTVDVALLRWDTSIMPDNATITAAMMRLATTGTRSSADARDVVAEYYASSNWPIDATDWTSTAANTAHAGTLMTSTSAVNGTQVDFVLTNLSNISLTSYTGIRVHVSGGAPAGINVFGFYSFEETVNPKPQLIITYTVPGGYHMII